MVIHELLSLLVAGETLSEPQSESLFESLLGGALDPAQIGAALALIQSRGVTVDELTGAARVMRRHVTPVQAPAGLAIVDTCGTGGAPKTFNISTAAAIIAAAAGRQPDVAQPIAVAKHGNRSRTGRGSAEILQSLGIHIDATPETQARCLAETGVCFCFAIHHHPAMRHAAGPRKALGVPTAFNLLGPLTNPARATRQLIGVYDASRLRVVAETLARLGAEHAWVARGDDGLDELTTTTTSRVAEVRDGAVTEQTIDPESLGIQPAELHDLRADDLDHAKRIIHGVLRGEASAALEIALLNAAAALHVGGAAADLAEGLARARAAAQSGAAAKLLESLARVSHAG
ncbi:MAG: anthranilate phosphoribosyltransferase [Planctomycetota bacterium]